MLSPYASARRRHADIRSDVYSFVRDQYVRAGVVTTDLRVTDIDRTAMEAWSGTWMGRRHPADAGAWNWPLLIECMPRRAAILPVALWSGDDLCGLILGRASRHRQTGVRHTVTLTYVERRPEPPPVPLRGEIVLLALSIATAYGKAVGASRIRLGYPEPRLIGWYERLGFVVARSGGKAVYCEREIKP
ncbi:hypothetical protein FHS01_004297 [Longimicrobium terrae]|uniref:N-acetyltransferase domain-containing protein n=1 Tax=Longimicrobium terrae TaxID=1639882 RepID=A0A841H772_9BACT|nr:hypothetical protein [Longimicrobium terrae]MBB6073793.1 hypothetical protein [Longimicrobium terrae]